MLSRVKEWIWPKTYEDDDDECEKANVEGQEEESNLFLPTLHTYVK